MIVYKLIKDLLTNKIEAVHRSDGWTIPFDPMNSDYVEYLKWLAEGNTPEPPDQPE